MNETGAGFVSKSELRFLAAQMDNAAMAATFDRYVEEFLLFCFSVDFQTH